MPAIRVEFYDLPDGSLPALDFLRSLDTKMRAKTTRTILLLEEKGILLREPYSKPLDDGIFELRTQAGNNITRVLFFFFVGNVAVLTNGFVKKSQKTPSAEIQKAKVYRAEFLSRKKGHNEKKEDRHQF